MLGPYRLERVLGTGSFATVWLARDEVLDRQVAVKILADNWSQDHDVRRRFLAEARVLLTVESPRIVRGFHLGETPSGQPYLVMAWADRGTLGDRLDQRRREGRTFDVAEVVGIGYEIAAALADVHRSGHLHRDVKPSNVLIRSSSTQHRIPGLGVDETAVLADFGLARGLDMSALTLVAGSPGYVAPEQAAGLTQLDRRADLYSLGRIMLELLTGDAGGRATTMAGAANERIDVAAEIAGHSERGGDAPPPELVALVARLVDEDPDRRPSTADQVMIELSAMRTTSGVQAGPPLRAHGPDDAADAAGERPMTGTQLGAAAPRRASAIGPKRLAAAGAVAVVVAVMLIVVLTRGDGGGGAGGTTTVAPLAATPPSESVAAPAVGGDSTIPPGSGPTVTVDAASSSAPATSVATVSTLADGPPESLAIDLAYVTLDSQPGELRGVQPVDPADFVAELLAANAGWEVVEPAPDLTAVADDTPITFELTNGADTATVTVTLQGQGTGVELTAFEVVYS
jgi:hypothetical protein